MVYKVSESIKNNYLNRRWTKNKVNKVNKVNNVNNVTQLRKKGKISKVKVEIITKFKNNNIMETVKIGNNIMIRAQKISGDGSCLFGAMAHQIHRSVINSQQHRNETKVIRRKIAQYIRNNLDSRIEFRYSILQRLQEDNTMTEEESVRESQRNENDMISNFLEQLEKNFQCWGGEESISAAKEIYERNIIVYQEEGNTIIYETTSNLPQTPIRIVYRRNRYDRRRIIRNHYDSVEAVMNQEDQSLTRTEREIRTPLYDIGNGIHRSEANQRWIIRTSQTSNQSKDTYKNNGLNIGTWNVRGGSNYKKREMLDNIMNAEDIIICCIQESRMVTCTTQTKNYIWHCTSDNQKTGAGVAIATRKGVRVIRKHIISNNSMAITTEIMGTRIKIVSCYIPPDERRKIEHLKLQEYLTTEEVGTETIILGDFNARIGTDDLTYEDRNYIGEQLYHKQTSTGGWLLKNLLHMQGLVLKNTFSGSRTVKITFSNGKSQSQIDHVLMKKNGALRIKKIRATWTTLSDHKLLVVPLDERKEENSDSRKRKRDHQDQDETTTTQSNLKRSRTTTVKSNWNLELLAIPEKASKYADELKNRLDQAIRNKQSEHTTVPAELASRTSNVDDDSMEWEEVKECIINAANDTLHTPKPPISPRRKEAGRRLERARKMRSLDWKNPIWKQRENDAKAEKEEAYRRSFWKDCEKMMNDLNDEKMPQVRLRKILRFMKKFKSQTKTKKQYIPMRKWQQELEKSCNGEQTTLFEEEERVDHNEEPSREEIKEIIANMKNRGAPGIDGINAELLKYGPDELLEKVYDIILKVWRSNEVPDEWKMTVQIPIPKIKNPQGIEDYRRLTLCNVTYKIYAKILLNRLEKALGDLPSYQAAFQKNRSTSDHIYAVRRVLEERWRKGKLTFVVALDLKKAFDTIDIRKTTTILKSGGATSYLMNRIINACIVEDTSIQWYGQRTRTERKTEGVKQGCPLSPRMFIYAIHDVLQTLCTITGKITLNDEGEDINFPALFAYADDIILLCEKREEVGEVMGVLNPLLLSIGLELNLTKCNALIRDPLDVQIRNTNRMEEFGTVKIKLISKLKYLGIYLTDTLHRKENVAERIKKAFAATHTIIPFIRKIKLPWNITLRIYHTVIAPIVLYGMPETCLTKQNRIALRTMEEQIIANLQKASFRRSDEAEKENENEISDETNESIKKIMKNKTINNKITVGRLRFWAHIQRREESHNLKKAEKYTIEGKLKVGRPCLTHHDSCLRDMEISKRENEIWNRMALNKQEMKKETALLYDTIIESDEEALETSDEDER
jgi:endonuclease/exonuclease/phosphatase family metal-dependent hydrolase